MTVLEHYAVLVADGFKPSDVDREARFVGSQFKHKQYLIDFLFRVVKVLSSRTGDDWSGFTWVDYRRTCAFHPAFPPTDDLVYINGMLKRGWLAEANGRYMPTAKFIKFVRKKDLRQPDVAAAKRRRDEERRVWLDERRPMVDQRTRSALTRIEALTSREQIENANGEIVDRLMGITMWRPFGTMKVFSVRLTCWFYDHTFGKNYHTYILEAEFRMEVLRAKLREIVNNVRKAWDLDEVPTPS